MNKSTNMMTGVPPASRAARSSADVLREQKAEAERRTAAQKKETQIDAQSRNAAYKARYTSDGWDQEADEAASHSIRGTLLKFADWRWTRGKEKEVVPNGTQLVALDVRAG